MSDEVAKVMWKPEGEPLQSLCVTIKNGTCYLGPEDKVGMLTLDQSAHGGTVYSVATMSEEQRIESGLDKIRVAELDLEMHICDENTAHFTAYSVHDGEKAVDPERVIGCLGEPTWIAAVIYAHAASTKFTVEQLPHQFKVDIHKLINWVIEQCLRAAKKKLPEGTDLGALDETPAQVNFYISNNRAIAFRGTLRGDSAKWRLENIQVRTNNDDSKGIKWAPYEVRFQGHTMCSKYGKQPVMPRGTNEHTMIFIPLFTSKSPVRPDSMQFVQKIEMDEKKKEKAKKRRAELKRKRETGQMDTTE